MILIKMILTMIMILTMEMMMRMMTKSERNARSGQTAVASKEPDVPISTPCYFPDPHQCLRLQIYL